MVFLSRRSRAGLHYARKRRLSLLSDAALFRTRVLQVGDSIDADLNFPNPLSAVTFEGVLEMTGTTVTTLLTAGALTLQTTATGLKVANGTFEQSVVVPVGRRLRFNLAMRSSDAEVRLWLDSERAIAAQFGTSPLAWHDGTNVVYDDTASATLLSPLSVYDLQRPRHFGDASVVLPDVTADNDILLRAAIATFLTGSFPFVDNPDSLS